jgi:CheY-like chemotaxis protein
MSNDDRVEHRKANSQSRVLVVDDEASNRELISEMLASEGYDVVTAQDGLDALSRLAVPLPDVIISDLRMPRMSGFEFLAVVRRKYPEVPLIAISGEFEGNEVPAGVPADAYLEKGAFSFNQLRTKISELLAAPPRKHPVIGFVGASAAAM